VPQYIKAIPVCPEAKVDTYSASYQMRKGPDFYRFYCAGKNHLQARLGPNLPRYDTTDGVRSSP
jgi:hypothetical protein